MKRFGFIIRYLWVLALLWLGGMTILFTPKTERVSDSENRMLAGLTPLSLDTIRDGSFMEGVDAWLSDGIVLRSRMIDASKRLTAAIAVPKPEADEGEQMMAAIEAEMNTETESPEPSASEPPAETLPEETASASAETEELQPIDAEPIRDTTFWIRYNDGKVRTVYHFPARNVQRAAKALNAYRALLPEDGRVIFAEVPIAGTGRAYQAERDIREAWGSDMEDELQKIVSDGVYIINATSVMLDPLERGEYVYFRTDHHWTPRGAWYLYRAMMQRLGIPAMDYVDYSYTTNTGMYGSAGHNGNEPDAIDVIHEILPTHSFVVRNLTKSTEVPYMQEKRAGYTAYLGGTLTPWRRFETGAQTGRTALLIGDSFSNALLPYLLPHYDRVMMTDLRPSYYSDREAGAPISAYIREYGVDDVYFMYCFATSINSGHFLNGHIDKYLD